MKTKLNFNERQNLIAITNQLAIMFAKLEEEWEQDRTKDGFVKLHTKAKKCMDKTFRAYQDIKWILNNMNIE